MNRFPLLLAVSFIALLATACHHQVDYTPKPVTYLRFDFPKKQYQLYDTLALPFSFERASDANITLKKNTSHEKWVDILYPKYRGVVFLSYKSMQGPQDLQGQIDTSYELLKMHFDYSSGVDEKKFVDPSHHIYATTYQLKGTNVASSYQFWATDSNSHFLRGSLYLDCTPNNDSLAPVLDYLQKDLKHLLETLKWRDE